MCCHYTIDQFNGGCEETRTLNSTFILPSAFKAGALPLGYASIFGSTRRIWTFDLPLIKEMLYRWAMVLMAVCTGIEPVIKAWQASVITTLLTHQLKIKIIKMIIVPYDVILICNSLINLKMMSLLYIIHLMRWYITFSNQPNCFLHILNPLSVRLLSFVEFTYNKNTYFLQ